MDENKLVHPSIKDSRVLMYLNLDQSELYSNTDEENALMYWWRTKYTIAKDEYLKSRANPQNLLKWRDAYEGKFNVLTEEGEEGEKRLKAIRKMAFELVEGKVNSLIPSPKMTPRYHADLAPVNATEDLLKHNIDKIQSEEVTDESEHQVLIDGTTWFKVMWNPLDNTHERSGNPIVKCCPADTVFPQPGVKDYKQLEYIFEDTTMTVAQIKDIYGRHLLSPTQNDIVPIVNCYFLNKDRYVGKFSWCDQTATVICNDLEWGIRKRRECDTCHTVVPIATVCPKCYGKTFSYKAVKEQILEEDLEYVSNPYRSGMTSDSAQDQEQVDNSRSLTKGTVIPHYLIRQLPFVPYKRVSAPNSIYGISEVELVFENQDLVNKMLNKAERKSAESKTWVTKLNDTNIENTNNEISIINVESPQEGQAIQVKQIMSDITEEFTQAQGLYEIAKSTVGVTDTDQGKNDPSARSGKAKQLQMAASAQRNTAPNSMRNMAYAGVYELIFKNLLAYCDEERSFVTLLPDGTQMEQVWSKYMFLAQDDYGEFYYRDDYAWSVDTATDITSDRAAMWQLIDNDYINGVMGNQIDPNRALRMYWQMKDQYGYPTAKYALAFLKDAEQHLPSDVERVLVENPEAVQLALSFIRDRQAAAGLMAQGAGGQGGARPGAGRDGNGASHAANVEKTNNKNRTQSGAAQTNSNAVATGGMQGGTGIPNIAGGKV